MSYHQSAPAKTVEAPSYKFSAEYLKEPLLEFAQGTHEDPKTGIIEHGPYSLRQSSKHPSTARIGIIGSAESIDSSKQWITDCAGGISGNGQVTDFPGCSPTTGFSVNLQFDEAWNAKITHQEQSAVLGIRNGKSRFEAALELLNEKLASIAALDRVPDCVVLALPPELVDECGGVDYREKGELIHRDFRRALKVVAMRHRLPTQILLQRTWLGGKGVDHKADCAWNFFTALYFKLGAIPWAPVGLDSETCFVGISFFRPLGSSSSMQASLAQAFNGRGDALVIRGVEFPWNPSQGERSPHLQAEHARDLIEIVLKKYAQETQGDKPRRVVIHKSSRFYPEEAEGFRAALADVREADFLSVRPSNQIRLLRTGNYPVLRGTRFTIGKIDYLYTTGYLPSLEEFPHGHVPSPLQLADHHGGDTPVSQLLREILILTKMNWNSAEFGGLMPVTLGSARIVGEIMREIPQTQEPMANYKYYV